MAVDPGSILAVAQVARVAVELLEQHQRGELSEEELHAGWATIHIQAGNARMAWEESKTTPAAVTRRAAQATQAQE